jgi:Protein of unknown function (DUF3365)
MRLKKLVIQAVIASVLIIGFGITAMTSQASSYNKPALNSPAVVHASQTTDILRDRLFAALGQEFERTTRETAAKGSDAISIIFNDRNHDMRLIGTVGPLRPNDRPKDAFERMVVTKALTKQLQPTDVIEAVDGKSGEWYYRRAIPINNQMASTCVLCHANYRTLPANKQTVGALALRVRIK